MLSASNNGYRFRGNSLILPIGYLGTLKLQRLRSAPLVKDLDYVVIAIEGEPIEVRAVPESLPDWDFPVTVTWRDSGNDESLSTLLNTPLALSETATDIAVFPHPDAIPTYVYGDDYTVDYRLGLVRRKPTGNIPENGWVSASMIFGGYKPVDVSVSLTFTVPGEAIVIDTAPLLNEAIGDYVYGTDYSVDRASGVIQHIAGGTIPIGEPVTLSYRSITPFCYATPEDYVNSFEQPDLAQQNWVAVTQALESATGTANFYINRAGIPSPSLPLSEKWAWLKATCLRLAKVDLRDCQPDQIQEEYKSALRLLEQLTPEDADDIADAPPAKVTAIAPRPRFGNVSQLYGG
jgi:hypothetical protein